jgi:hypothetical protein
MSPVLNPICRGFVGYISYLAACRTSTVYSEYLLYEPILRIAISQGYTAYCEVPVSKRTGPGDHRRIDFKLQRDSNLLAIEVKWLKKSKPNITKDVDKLRDYKDQTDAKGYVLFFGPSQYFEKLTPTYKGAKISEGTLTQWNAGKTNYCAKWMPFA